MAISSLVGRCSIYDDRHSINRPSPAPKENDHEYGQRPTSPGNYRPVRAATAAGAGGGLAGARAGREGGDGHVRDGGDVRDPRRYPAAAADGEADRPPRG